MTEPARELKVSSQALSKASERGAEIRHLLMAINAAHDFLEDGNFDRARLALWNAMARHNRVGWEGLMS